MTVVCPKCASVEARSVVMVYREAAASRRGRSVPPLSRDAEPPRKRNVVGWLAITFVLIAAFMVDISSLGLSTLVLGGLALTGVWMTRHISTYNATDLPNLMKRWERSVMCNRCGHVYSGPDSSP